MLTNNSNILVGLQTLGITRVVVLVLVNFDRGGNHTGPLTGPEKSGKVAILHLVVRWKGWAKEVGVILYKNNSSIY